METSRTKTAVLLAIIPAAAAIAVALIQYHPWTSTAPSRSPGPIYRPPGAATTVPPPEHMSPLEPNVSRDYSDYRDFSVYSAVQCSNACLAETRCKAMTFVPHAGGGTCWLKNAVPEARVVPNDISATKIE